MSANKRIKIIQGDITKLKTDAIVNAANRKLLGGGGVDGAIHRAAGPGLLEECKLLGGCSTGESKITRGYKLPCKFVIHTVGPVWRGGNQNEEKLLESCYKNSLQLAALYEIKSVAFPSVSTGAYGFPFNEASIIAIKSAHDFLKTNSGFKEIIFVLFSDSDYQNFMNIYQNIDSLD